ncbi:MAG: hypothetical protein FWG68_01060, partial [Defluviitaleaceae bacterium]|nr:hypothetical protein [Defluviitaleaceae bacterium]
EDGRPYKNADRRGDRPRSPVVFPVRPLFSPFARCFPRSPVVFPFRPLFSPFARYSSHFLPKKSGCRNNFATT